jgi:alpha-L-arabinofuranosidase
LHGKVSCDDELKNKNTGMKKYMRIPILSIVLLLFIGCGLYSQQATEINVVLSKPLAAVQPTMWGVFFEDINFAADGGLYAELVKNRSFEFSLPLTGWKITKQNGNGRLLPTFYSPANSVNPRYLEIVCDSADGSFGLTNEGFRGMGVKKGEQYSFSVNAIAKSGSGLVMTVELITPTGEIIGSSGIKGLTTDWKSYKCSLTPTATEPKAQLRVMIKGKGTVGLDMISLFPADTWKGRPGGLRKDIAQLIADLKPGFVRFPGGCIVEGRDLTNRYQWKYTVGPVDQRKLIINRWNMEMQDRQAPDYFQSFGLGFYEYFLFSEDIGAEPLPILNCGMSCQFNAGEVVPLNELDPYIQDALDLIEFANGPVTSQWGKLRAAMGHPESFKLKYVGVGNEQWDEQYIERYKAFEKVLRAKYPGIKIVSGAGPSASGRLFDYAWSELKKLTPDLVDEHYYMAPEWFLNNASRYDNYNRKGPKVFAGEYAGHWKEGNDPESRNTWYSALSEAAFMTGLERNADVVQMASYAPLLAHVEAWQWRPDLIWFDNLKVVATPNYFVQKMYSTHRGTNVISVTSGGKTLSGQDSLYASGTIDWQTGKAYIKLVNASAATRSVILTMDLAPALKEAVKETLKSDKFTDFNSVANPLVIAPVSKTITATGKKINFYLDPHSANTIILTTKK